MLGEQSGERAYKVQGKESAFGDAFAANAGIAREPGTPSRAPGSPCCHQGQHLRPVPEHRAVPLSSPCLLISPQCLPWAGPSGSIASRGNVIGSLAAWQQGADSRTLGAGQTENDSGSYRSYFPCPLSLIEYPHRML